MKKANQISYNVTMNFFDHLASEFFVFWRYKRPRIYLALTFPLCLFLAILATEGYLWITVCVFCYILGMWTLVFLHRIELAIDSTIRLRKYTDKDKVSFFDEEKGFGFETGDSAGWMGWNEFDIFKETGRFFLLHYKTGATHVIHKRTLPSDTIMKIREILGRKLKAN